MPSYINVKNEVMDELRVQQKYKVLNIPIILGPVGLGKSSIAEECAADLGLLYRPVNCGDNSDPTDVIGVPVPREDGQFPTTVWGLNTSAVDACREPTLLFFDDIDKAPPIVQGALIGLWGTRRFRDAELHPDTVVLAAGNRLDDDMYANELSESIRTRGTVVNLEPSFEDFARYARQTGDIHPVIVGFLSAYPELLHKHDQEVARFPTPRGYREASMHLFENENNDKKWARIIERKVGTAVSNDFEAWYTILRKVDVEEILSNGRSSGEPSDPKEKRLYSYAACFAVSNYLQRNNIRKSHKGIERFINDLSKEMRIAFVLQLRDTARRQLIDHFPDTATKVVEHLFSHS